MDKHVLELHWLNVRYVDGENGTIVHLDGAYFAGPALRIAAKIQNNESIKLDFTEQYAILLKKYHIANLKWGEVIYSGDIAYLKDAQLYISDSCVVPNFLSDDFLVIDTSFHEEETHNMYLNYNTRTFSSLREGYVFG